MVCAPWPFTLRVSHVSVRQILNLLINNDCLYQSLVFLQDYVAEILVEVMSYDKDNLSKSCSDCVIHRVVHNGLAVRADFVQLLQSSVAASHACRQYK